MTSSTVSSDFLSSQFNELLRLVNFVLPSEDALGWRGMLISLAPDVVDDTKGVSFLGLINAPAAKGNHHAYPGGLVAHYLEMWQLWTNLKNTLPADPLLTDARVLKGIILHDLSKCWCTFVRDDSVDSGFNYGKHPSASLLTNDQKSAYIVNRCGLRLDLIDLNVLYSSEGGWAESPPKWCTVLAKLVYLLDDMSGNVLARLDAGNTIDLRTELRYDPLFDL